MKKLFVFVAAIFTLSLVSCEKETLVPETELPKEITAYIQEHFRETAVVQSVKETELADKNWEVYLEGGVLLKFNKSRKITDIESMTALPESVVPQKIREVVATKYPDNFIRGWELDDRN
ncbi:MAG TPA: PepSY-like domain-containing protein, partial [Prolixibacteraceae bacterium]|nr:PepSY-like domain-containing protein [Prolixibacteraceae bacterium]